MLNATKVEDLPPVMLAKDGWDTVFRGAAGDPSGCGSKDLSAWCGLMPQAAQDLGRRSYYANVAFIDEWVGKIMAALTETEALENTYILWSADHGDGQEDHYHWRKGFPYELCIQNDELRIQPHESCIENDEFCIQRYEFSSHVPLLFRWPANFQKDTVMKRGHVETTLVTELRDVFPTFLDAAGAMATVPKGHPIDGMSLLCLLKDPTGKTCTGCNSATGCSKDGSGWRKWCVNYAVLYYFMLCLCCFVLTMMDLIQARSRAHHLLQCYEPLVGAHGRGHEIHL